GWKTILQKTKIKDNGLQKALATYGKIAEDAFDERLKTVAAVVQLAKALKKAKDVAASEPASDYLDEVIHEGEAAQSSIAKAKADALKTAATKVPERSIPVPPLGKLSYLVPHEREVLPQLTEAVKEYTSVTDMDAQLREKFTAMDAFSKRIPPLSVVKDEFAKVNADVKLEAQNLQAISIQVQAITTQVKLFTEEAKEARKNLVITEQELKSAQDIQKAKALKAQLDMG